MNNLTHFFSNEFVAALGWSLLHSLWQGALIALLLGIVLLFLQKRSSNLRYTLAASSLGLTLIAFFGTFAYLFNAAKSQQQAFNDTLYIVTQENYTEFANQIGNQSLFSIFLEYFNQHLPIIVVFWLLGVLVLSLRFLGGLSYLKRLRYTQNQEIGEHWQERLNSIKSQIGLNKSVQLLESALIKVPMVIGYMKPLVLLPIGTINALSAAEVEAILAHELAHIKRNDYLINLIQSIIDVLFFYHPAVWWMSNTVRTERENCCDDLALAVTGNSLIIAKALASLESIRQRSYHLSLAFTGNKNQLFNRISRLLGQPMKKNNHFVEGLVAVIVIILCLTTINYRVNAAVTEIEDEFTELEIVGDSIIPKIESILEEGEEIIKEYIVIEEEIELSTTNSSSSTRWVKHTDGSFTLVEIPNSSEKLFSNALGTIDNTTMRWVKKDNDDEPVLIEIPNLPKKSFSIRKVQDSDGNIQIVEIPNSLNQSSSTRWIKDENDSFELIEMPDFPKTLFSNELGLIEETTTRWVKKGDKKLALIEVPTSGNNEFLFDNSSDSERELFDENYEYKWKIKNAKDIKIDIQSIDAIADTSILEDAEIIIIDGDKVTVVRKKSKLSKSEKARLKSKLKHLDRLDELEELDDIRNIERTKARLKATERRLEAEKERLEHQIQAQKERTKAQKERIKAQEERMKIHSKERMKAQEKRMQAQEQRMKAQEERMRKMEIKNKESAEQHKLKTERLEAALRKDGILKEGEKLNTINLKKENGKTILRINGKKLPGDQAKKYIKIIEE
jgi:beta-lactamase regulating signal transducer with metallopeptidase domain